MRPPYPQIPPYPEILFCVAIALGGCSDEAATVEPELEPQDPVATEIVISPEEAALEVEETRQFEAAVLDSEGTEITEVTVTWASSDTTVLTITDDGLATGLNPGFADVIAFADSAEGAAEVRVMLPLAGAPGLDGNIFYGYQGWFGCPGDGAEMGWLHWFWEDTPTAEEVTVDMWPDVSELDEDELCRTDMTLPDGSPAYAFSSHNRKTVMRHFRWMQEYGLDGAVLQRFVKGPGTRDIRRDRKVVEYARDAAEIYGRRFFIMYDIGENERAFEFLTHDWPAMVDDLGLVDSPSYVKVDGRPVVGLWGFGLKGDEGGFSSTAAEAMAVLRWLHEEAPPRMRAFVLGGVPTWWRTRTRDAQTDPAWDDVYRSFDVLSPWLVGRFKGEAEADTLLHEVILPDLEETRRLGIPYMPVAWPGSSIHNLAQDPPFNEFPREGGRFFWRQIYNLVAADVSTIYVAMFDEVDEGTAMFKLAPTEEHAPVGAPFVTLDIDGYDLPSDWYLQLGREAGRMLRGEIPLSPEMPITPP